MKERFSKMLWTGVLAVLLGTGMSNLSAFEQGWQEQGWRGDRCYDKCYDNGFDNCWNAWDSCCEEPCFAFWGDWIYWNVCQDDMDTSISDSSVVPDVLTNAETNFFDSDYKSGFRLGASYRLPCDCWSLEAIWTRYHPKWHQTDDPSTGGKIVPTHVPNALAGATVFGEVQTENRLRYDQLDVLFAKTYRWGDCFKVRPYFGARVLWLKQKFNTTAVGTAATVDTQWRYDLPAGGVTLGFEGKYGLCGNISLTGHFGTSILGGRVEHHHDWFVATGATTEQGPGVWFSEHRHHCQFIGGWDASVGIAYDSTFCDCPWFFAVGYEINDWWNTPKDPRFVNGGPNGSLGQITSDSGSRLTLHGLFVRAGTTF